MYCLPVRSCGQVDFAVPLEDESVDRQIAACPGPNENRSCSTALPRRKRNCGRKRQLQEQMVRRLLKIRGRQLPALSCTLRKGTRSLYEKQQLKLHAFQHDLLKLGQIASAVDLWWHMAITFAFQPPNLFGKLLRKAVPSASKLHSVLTAMKLAELQTFHRVSWDLTEAARVLHPTKRHVSGCLGWSMVILRVLPRVAMIFLFARTYVCVPTTGMWHWAKQQPHNRILPLFPRRCTLNPPSHGRLWTILPSARSHPEIGRRGSSRGTRKTPEGFAYWNMKRKHMGHRVIWQQIRCHSDLTLSDCQVEIQKIRASVEEHFLRSCAGWRCAKLQSSWSYTLQSGRQAVKIPKTI